MKLHPGSVTPENKAMLTLIILLSPLITMQAASSDCGIITPNIDCSCFNNSITCTGVQNNMSQIRQLLSNISQAHLDDYLHSFVLDIKNLTLQPPLTTNDSQIENLAISFGIPNTENDSFPELEISWLHLHLNNALSHVPSDALSDLHKLEQLYLSNNQIKELRPNDFNGLNSLKKLYLGNNSIDAIDKHALNYLSTLKELYLDFNNLSIIEPSMFQNLTNLETLKLSGNRLTKLPPDIVENLPSIKNLSIDYNNVTSFSNLNISSSSLNTLSARYCSIEGDIKTDTLQNLPNLTFVDFSCNSINEIQTSALSGLKNLLFLNLSNNVIERLNDRAFENLYNLVELDLKNNNIAVIGRGAFFNLTNLKVLDLGNNKLKSFLCQYTSELLSLEKINLQENDIRLITPGTFLYSPQLTRLELAGNILDCSCGLSSFGSFLNSSTTILKEDLDNINCSLPSPLRGELVIKVDFQSQSCVSLAEPCESAALQTDDFDYFMSSFSTPSENNTISTTPLYVNISGEINDTVGTTTIELITTPMINASEHETTVTHIPEATNFPMSTGNASSFSTVETTTIELITSPMIIVSEFETTVTHIPQTTNFPTSTGNTSSFSTVETTTIELITTPTIIVSEHETAATRIPETTNFPSSTGNASSFSTVETTTIELTTPTIAVFDLESTVTDIPETTNFPSSTDDVSSSTPAHSTIGMSTKTTERTTLKSLITEDTMTSQKTSDFYNDTGNSFDASTESSSLSPGTTTKILNSSLTTTVEPNKTTEEPYFEINSSTTFHPDATSIIDNYSTTTGKLEASTSTTSEAVSLYTGSYDEPEITLKKFSFKSGNFCVEWSISIIANSMKCRLTYSYDSDEEIAKTIKCPLDHGKSVSQCMQLKAKVSLNDFCIHVHFRDEDEEYLDCEVLNDDDKSSTLSSTKNSTFPTSEITREIDEDSSAFSISEATTTEFTNFSSTKSTKLLVVSPTTTHSIYPFNITFFDVVVKNSSTAFVLWKVNRIETLEICHLTLFLMTKAFNRTEALFKCESNSHVLDINEHRNFDICLLSFYSTSKGKICNHFSHPEYGFSTSSNQNSRFQSFPLIILVCLLIVVMLIILLIAFKKFHHKRGISNRYDVSEEERKVQRRIKPSHREPYVRYSYISKENVDV